MKIASRWGSRSLAALALLAAAVGSPGSVSADKRVRHPVIGKPHEFLVPNGWSTQEIQAGVKFIPPAGRAGASFSCGVIAIEGVLDRPALEFVKILADDEIRENKPWATPTEPTNASFMGVQGGLILLVGTNPQSRVQEATIYLVAGANGLIYLFSAQGALTDVNALSPDMDSIVNNAMYVGTTQPNRGGNQGGNQGGSFGGRGPEIHDALWGLDVAGLSGRWRLTYEGTAYVLMSEEPQATFTLEYEGFAKKKSYIKSKALKKQGKLGGYDAYVVEKQTEQKTPLRVYYIVRDDHALVVSFTSVAFAEAEKIALAAFEKALKLTPPPAVAMGKKKGVKLALSHGVKLELDAPWSVEGIIASGAEFSYQARGIEGRVKVYAFTRPSQGDEGNPFDAEATKFQFNCSKGKGEFDEKELQISGAAEAKRYRCRNVSIGGGKSTGNIMILAKGRGQSPVYFMIQARYDPSQGETPDGIAREFTDGLSLP